MISTFDSNAVHRGFKLRSGQTIVNKLVYVTSPQRNAALMRKSKEGSSRNQNNVSFLPVDCCFSELAQSKPINHVGLVQSEHHHNHLNLKFIHI